MALLFLFEISNVHIIIYVYILIITLFYGYIIYVYINNVYIILYYKERKIYKCFNIFNGLQYISKLVIVMVIWFHFVVRMAIKLP